MYPGIFRPTTLVALTDGYGHVATNLQCQLFKPLLAYQTNGPQTKITPVIPNAAGIILRGLCKTEAGSSVVPKPGPPYWRDNKDATMVLQEDPNGDVWTWLDAIPWDFTGGTKLWSFFSAKAYTPPPPPTPVTAGASAALAPLVVSGTTYVSTIPASSTGFVYLNRATGVPLSITTTAPTGTTMGMSTFGGDHSGVTAIESGPVTTPNTLSVTGAGHTGPDAIFSFANAAMAPQDVVFTIT